MFWSTLHLYFFPIGNYPMLKFIVTCTTVRVSICAIKAYAFERRSNKAKVSLIGYLSPEYSAIISIRRFLYLISASTYAGWYFISRSHPFLCHDNMMQVLIE